MCVCARVCAADESQALKHPGKCCTTELRPVPPVLHCMSPAFSSCLLSIPASDVECCAFLRDGHFCVYLLVSVGCDRESPTPMDPSPLSSPTFNPPTLITRLALAELRGDLASKAFTSTATQRLAKHRHSSDCNSTVSWAPCC